MYVKSTVPDGAAEHVPGRLLLDQPDHVIPAVQEVEDTPLVPVAPSDGRHLLLVLTHRDHLNKSRWLLAVLRMWIRSNPQHTRYGRIQHYLTGVWI